jgi:two-component system, chemotaxis family, protein-glutamate methylesterase/glutaminase
MIIDDSALVRQVLQEVLSTDPDIEVIGSASDPFRAAELLRERVPNVILLDIEMPKMDGITFLKKLMHQHPIPTIICSSLVQSDSPTTMAALEAGAVDIILKPSFGKREFFEESKIRICDAVKAASLARLRRSKSTAVLHPSPKLSADAVLRPARANTTLRTTEKVVAIGASTGGTEALREFLEAMPLDCPGVVIVQHMPELFTAAFANRLNQICKITVKEASTGDAVIRGQAIIARGNHHLLLRRSGAQYSVQVIEGALVNRHRPSVDVLFRSTAESAGPNAVGVIMTGMGDDGARGLKEMKDAGAKTIAQDEATSVVYGMPAEAVKRGGVDKIVPLDAIPTAVLRYCEQ